MLYHFLYPLHQDFPILNVFRYITFRSLYAAATALFLAFALGRPVIQRLRALKIGQQVRDDGPQSHLPKAGTPTMGGVLIVIAIVIPTLLWGNLENRSVWIALLATLWMGFVGLRGRLPPRGEAPAQRTPGTVQAGGADSSRGSGLRGGLFLSHARRTGPGARRTCPS